MSAEENTATENKEGYRDNREEKGGYKARRSFGRKKVCPFILDKSLVLDFKNVKMINRFVTESGKIVPRHVSGVSAKNQRKLTKQIKRARNVGLIAAKLEG